ncbi:MAG: hypothetical protein ACR2ID_11095 [Chthoniobacterales bacterium]
MNFAFYERPLFYVGDHYVSTPQRDVYIRSGKVDVTSQRPEPQPSEDDGARA